MDKNELLKTLLAIDEEAFLMDSERPTRSQVIIVGGAAFLLRDMTARRITHDIDILQADTFVRQIIAQYPNANGAVAAYMDHIPYNFEDRLVPLPIKTKAVDYFTPSIEDLAVMKLYAERPADMQDIDEAARNNNIDWQLLDHLVHDAGEAHASALSARRYGEMVGAFERFYARWH